MDDIFKIQDEMALNIVSNLDVSLKSDEKQMLLKDPAANVSIYEKLLDIQKYDVFQNSITDQVRENKIIIDEILSVVIECNNLFDATMMEFILSRSGIRSGSNNMYKDIEKSIYRSKKSIRNDIKSSDLHNANLLVW